VNERTRDLQARTAELLALDERMQAQQQQDRNREHPPPPLQQQQKEDAKLQRKLEKEQQIVLPNPKPAKQRRMAENRKALQEMGYQALEVEDEVRIFAP
jgi:hypothetical protein